MDVKLNFIIFLLYIEHLHISISHIVTIDSHLIVFIIYLIYHPNSYYNDKIYI
jgi:dolichyl-phosphate-mannose--protein O-mannosyl transferase